MGNDSEISGILKKAMEGCLTRSTMIVTLLSVAATIGGQLVIDQITNMDALTPEVGLGIIVTLLSGVAVIYARVVSTGVSDIKDLTKKTENKIEDLASQSLRQQAFHYRKDQKRRNELFRDVLLKECRDAESSIVIVNYFAGVELEQLRTDSEIEIQNYYQELWKIYQAQSIRYIRIIQLSISDFEKVRNGQEFIDGIVKDPTQVEHFKAIAQAQREVRRFGENTSCTIVIPRRIAMTYTIIDEERLMIQIDTPPDTVEGEQLTTLWGILEVLPPPAVLENRLGFWKNYYNRAEDTNNPNRDFLILKPYHFKRP